MSRRTPGRLLGLAGALTPDPTDPVALANVALANMRAGDRLPPGYIVAAIDDRSITFGHTLGRTRVLAIGETYFGKLVPHVASVVSGHWHGLPVGDVISALQRDAAYRLVRGLHAIVDEAPHA